MKDIVCRFVYGQMVQESNIYTDIEKILLWPFVILTEMRKCNKGCTCLRGFVSVSKQNANMHGYRDWRQHIHHAIDDVFRSVSRGNEMVIDDIDERECMCITAIR